MRSISSMMFLVAAMASAAGIPEAYLNKMASRVKMIDCHRHAHRVHCSGVGAGAGRSLTNFVQRAS